MAKVRVYELARELNLESKELVEKLLAGGMNIKNYMSTLDEEAVARARDIVSGKVSEVVEEKRIRPTVIRRRRKKVTIEVKQPEAEAERKVAEKTAPEVVTRPEAEADLGVKEEELEVKAEAAEAKKVEVAPPGKEQEVEEVPKEVPEKRVQAKPVKPKKRKKKEEPAKIIRRPEEGPLKDILAQQAEEEKEEVRPKPTHSLKPLEIAKEVAEKAAKAKAGKKKEKRREEPKELAPKKVVRHRKKEIFERAELYEGRVPKRKEKKSAKKLRQQEREIRQTEITVPKAVKRKLRVPESVTVAELAKAMGIKAAEVIKKLMALGVVATINQSVDFETAVLVADEFGYELELESFEEELLLEEEADKPEDLVSRPPVVTIMGHVDHGKTSLLDYIRKSNIISGESGGITQHIGAYYVEAEGGSIVFLDTPGHEAFTAMRARGAKVTDLIVLVVAADDGVMPQTREAINHARAADIPIVVAINKMDKPEANPEKVKRELAELDLVPEEWGGDTIFGYVSAKTGEGVDELLSLILLQAEMLELKGNPKKPARGTIIEARLDKTRGPVATVLIKNGTLKPGDYFVCGEHYGRVRAMLNHRGKKMISAGPSMPVEVYGISGVPMAGDDFIVVKDERSAKRIAERRMAQSKKQELARKGIVSLDDLFQRIKEGEAKELNVVLKTDVQGSLEALSDSLDKLSTDEVKVNIIHSATGAITESDVMLASASDAIIIGFNVRANPRVSEIAEKEKVDIRYYDVIYNVLQDIRRAMAGLLEPVFKEEIIGRVDVKAIFHVPKVGTVAGCYVTDGHVERTAKVRVLRDDVVVFDGKIASLKRFKDDVKEVQAGYECGIAIEGFQDVKPGDVFEVYMVEEVEAEL
ncbi:MAG: translation initiation factor IF-2 [Deltaproteobacteria bacterium]|nr:translation initiation factor IF-2 [Deltaproteobacteria bacterium]MBW2081513.1 translation initiation factor IF-2 [Deltaproteobacteria bacterium]HDM10460.1 translation initiation factor IF-2 [Desulfobacteraceae bacterium]